MFEYARLLHQEINKQGARTVFYLTWARQDIPEMQAGADPLTSPRYARAMYQISGAAKTIDLETWCAQRRSGLAGGLNGAYFDIAQELKAEVAPVGMAWQRALQTDASRVLHMSDKSHPNPSGSYLAACVFYATLFGRSPVGLPGDLKIGNRIIVEIAPNEAKWLQEVAWRTVQEVKQGRM